MLLHGLFCSLEIRIIVKEHKAARNYQGPKMRYHATITDVLVAIAVDKGDVFEIFGVCVRIYADMNLSHGHKGANATWGLFVSKFIVYFVLIETFGKDRGALECVEQMKIPVLFDGDCIEFEGTAAMIDADFDEAAGR